VEVGQGQGDNVDQGLEYEVGQGDTDAQEGKQEEGTDQ